MAVVSHDSNPQVESRGDFHAALHRDDELADPRVLSDRRLVDIARQCLVKWDAYPTIPGSRRWARNGGVALSEIERRLIDRG